MSCADGPQSSSGPFRLDRCCDLSRLRRALEDAGYTEAAIGKSVLLDREGTPMDAVTLRRRVSAPSPFHTLVRLFILGSAVSEEAAREAMSPAELNDLDAVGLLERCAEGIRARAALMPSGDLLFAREFWPDFTQRPKSRDHVLGVGPATRVTGYLTVRRRGEAALDVGTGAGYQALTAARHAGRVIATDINRRALSFAAFNARLNSLPNIEFRHGSLFEPVAQERFDLIVANPPFVLSPGSEYEYRDSGLPGDALVEQVIRQAPGMLSEGGYCTVLMNWHHRTEEDWAERPAGWLASSGCDAWLLVFESCDPIGYAATWLYPECGRDPQRYAEAMENWLANLERLGADAISFGAAILRRRSGRRNWFRADLSPSGVPTQPCSAQIERIFAAQDFLESSDTEETLLGQRFGLSSEHQMEQFLTAQDGHWMAKAARIKQTEGFPFEGNVDRLVSTILAGCDGQRTLGELVAGLASALGLDLHQVSPSCCRLGRTLLRWGFLTVVPHECGG